MIKMITSGTSPSRAGIGVVATLISPDIGSLGISFFNYSIIILYLLNLQNLQSYISCSFSNSIITVSEYL